VSDAPIVGKKPEPPDWEGFRETGLLWWVNRQLHLFGWTICVEVNEAGEVQGGFPVRTNFRGFGRESEELGFSRLGKLVSPARPERSPEEEAP